MPARPRAGSVIHDQDVQGLKYLPRIRPLLSRLRKAGAERDRAGNRRQFMDQYCALILMSLFGPAIESLRDLQRACLDKVRMRLGVTRASVGSLAESVAILIRWRSRRSRGTAASSSIAAPSATGSGARECPREQLRLQGFRQDRSSGQAHQRAVRSRSCCQRDQRRDRRPGLEVSAPHTPRPSDAAHSCYRQAARWLPEHARADVRRGTPTGREST